MGDFMKVRTCYVMGHLLLMLGMLFMLLWNAPVGIPVSLLLMAGGATLITMSRSQDPSESHM